MFPLLARRISTSFSSDLQHHHLAILTPLFRLSLSSSTTSQPQPQPQPQPQKETPFIVEYLISSFGVSPDQALKFSTRRGLAAIKSPDRPEAVVRFLKDTGLSDAQIKGAISSNPNLLSYNVEKSMKPNVLELIARGFSVEILAQLIQYNPGTLILRETPSRLLYWRDLIGEDDETFLKFIKRNRFLIGYDIDKRIVPRMNHFKELGLSNKDIAVVFGSGHSFVRRSPDSLRKVVDLIENLGIPRGSGMFLSGLKVVGNYSADTIKRKIEFFKQAFGWSEHDVCAAFRKFPFILQYSEEKVKSTMDFLIREAKLESSSIVSMPNLFGYSLEKRLIPRYQVLSILVSKKLKEKHNSLLGACVISEKTFLKKYIEPYKKDVPELSDAYLAAFGWKVAA